MTIRSREVSLASLGITYSASPDYSVPPERIITDFLNKDSFIGNEDYGFLKLFFFHYHNFIEIQKLGQESKGLSEIGKATLSSLCFYCLEQLNAKKFKHFKFFPLPEKLIIPPTSQDRIDAGVIDKYLAEFNIVIRPIKKQHDKKILPINSFVNSNPWLRDRRF